LTIMKVNGHGAGTIVLDKLVQVFTSLAAMLRGDKSDAKIAEDRQIRQLAGAIPEYGRMGSQFHSHQPVGVEVEELAFRFRETPRDVVTALLLLENEGRASRTRLAGYWSLRIQPQNTKEVFTSHENQRRA